MPIQLPTTDTAEVEAVFFTGIRHLLAAVAASILPVSALAVDRHKNPSALAVVGQETEDNSGVADPVNRMIYVLRQPFTVIHPFFQFA